MKVNQPPPSAYDPIEPRYVPEGINWKPAQGCGRRKNLVVLFSMGNIYKLVRELATGAVTYYKLKDAEIPMSPAEKLDAEEKQKRKRLDVGTHCWFIDEAGNWHCVHVVKRTQVPNRIAIASVTGWDAERRVAWPYGEELEFPGQGPLFQRLRGLKARQV